MVEYVMDDFGISQVLSQHRVDPATLLTRERFVFLTLVLGVRFLFVRKFVLKQILSQ